MTLKTSEHLKSSRFQSELTILDLTGEHDAANTPNN